VERISRPLPRLILQKREQSTPRSQPYITYRRFLIHSPDFVCHSSMDGRISISHHALMPRLELSWSNMGALMSSISSAFSRGPACLGDPRISFCTFKRSRARRSNMMPHCDETTSRVIHRNEIWREVQYDDKKEAGTVVKPTLDRECGVSLVTEPPPISACDPANQHSKTLVSGSSSSTSGSTMIELVSRASRATCAMSFFLKRLWIASECLRMRLGRLSIRSVVDLARR
jgi:hypothetical protein